MSQDETAVNTEVESQESTVTESAPVETKTPEVADPLLDVLKSDEDSPIVEPTSQKEAEAETEEKADDTASEDEAEQEQPQGEEKPLNPKSENRFQKLANENRELKEYVERLHAEVYKPQTAEELEAEGLSPELAEVRALKQQLEVQAYNNQVVQAQTELSEDSGRVLQDFPIFDPDSPDYQEDLAVEAAKSLERVLVKDPNTGQIIGSHLSPYQIYKPIADAYQKSSLKGQIAGQKATEKMLASVDVPTSVTPKAPKKDPLLDILSSDD
jgi:hypothetical protein